MNQTDQKLRQKKKEIKVEINSPIGPPTGPPVSIEISGDKISILDQLVAEARRKIKDVAGLVGNASSLLDAINKLVRTTAGVGVFLTIIGLIFMFAASWIALKIY